MKNIIGGKNGENVDILYVYLHVLTLAENWVSAGIMWVMYGWRKIMCCLNSKAMSQITKPIVILASLGMFSLI